MLRLWERLGFKPMNDCALRARRWHFPPPVGMTEKRNAVFAREARSQMTTETLVISTS
jgi:hypothetical protein